MKGVELMKKMLDSHGMTSRAEEHLAERLARRLLRKRHRKVRFRCLELVDWTGVVELMKKSVDSRIEKA